MSGFFAGGTHWDLNESENAAVVSGAKRLSAAGIEGALKEAQLIWSSAMPRRHIDHGQIADGTTIARFEAMIAHRAARVPLSHLIGYRDFYRHRFIVTAAVLDPRPDTETLVIEALKLPFERVLDLGTGSGCILLSLLADRPAAVGTGTDLSVAALDVATKNAAKLEINHRATFLESDWFSQVSGRFDLIVSNPPYIAADEMDALQPEVRLHEPRLALTDEADGLACYTSIIADASDFLTETGYLMFEIGPTQATAVGSLMKRKGFADVRVICDLDGRDRVVLGRNQLN